MTSINAAIVFLALLIAPCGLAAQERYPSRPVKLIVGSVPGGVHDIIGRLWAERVKATFSGFVIDNRGGVGGYIGAADTAAAKPDGYTIFLASTSTHILVPALVTKSRYDPIKDFAPAAIFAGSSVSIVVSPLLPVNTLQELIDHARANPGKLTSGTAGPGTITHIAGELFWQLAGGLKIEPVHYKGAGPGLADLMSGHIPVFTPNVTSNVLQLHRAGKIRILAIASPERLTAMPDIPTASEAGVPGMVARMFYGIVAPAGTPRAVLAHIHHATEEAIRDEAFQQILTKAGFEPIVDLGLDQLVPYIIDESKRWTPIVKATGAKID